LSGTVTGTDTGNSPETSFNKIKAIPGVKVSLSLKGRIKYRTTTDSTGAFTLKKVKANEYTLKVTRKSYKTYKQSYEMKQKDVSSLEITLNKK
jgi:hypothetical protein